MTREHLGRVEKLAEYHKDSPEKVKCSVPYDQRYAAIEDFRGLYLDTGPGIFTASTRTGIMFFLLAFGEACVCEIQLALDEASQPLVSHHLREMKQAGWLICERRGQWTYYALAPEKRASLTRFLGLLKEE
ncbi:MAG: ArsR/SmtB family transcription factor [Candidatus Sifarchaeia archaeon]